jgi:outer membrane protein assembly factor BamB
MRAGFRTVLSGLVLTFHAATGQAALSDWPEFRGPTGQGIAADATPPVEWNAEKNIAWKAELPGAGWSSPIVYGGAIYLTTALLDGDGNPRSLRALRINGDNGAVEWDQEVFAWSGPAQKHAKNGYASPTPVAADGRIYVHFGPMGTACLDSAGKVLWRQQGLAYETPHGNGGSPVLFGGKLIFSCDDAKAPFVAALDQNTGDIAWKTMRPTDASMKFSFCTPLVLESGGEPLVVSPGSGMVCAYRPGDGAEVWRVLYGEGFSIVPRPVSAHGFVYMATGFARPSSVYAIRLGGQGDVTSTHVAWTTEEGTPHTPSMLLVEKELYYLSDRGEFTCADAATGAVHWQESLDGKFSSSPVFADGRIYATNEDGVTCVVAAGTDFKRLAENPLGERTFASAAVCGKSLFLRTESHLYRIEAP